VAFGVGSTLGAGADRLNAAVRSSPGTLTLPGAGADFGAA